MSKAQISILGATSHISKGLIYNFLSRGMSHLHLFTTSPSETYHFIKNICSTHAKRCTIHAGYHEFASCSFDVVINCIGVGTQKKLCGDFTKYFTVGEKYDNIVIEYLQNHSPEALYISFSSGAVYGRSYAKPVTEWTQNIIKVNHVAQEDYYSICKLNSEAKHRAFSHLKIVDLRLFSYFSRFIDISDGYFITDVIDSIKNNKVLVTDSSNFVRDYVHPDDLFAIILKCCEAENINGAYDVMSASPVEKWEILKYFSNTYGLKYRLSDSNNSTSPTGTKNVYYSEFDKVSSLGYQPTLTSIDTIVQESKYLVKSLDTFPIDSKNAVL
jgi:nucleoside-diphosphate-sugar epimerase